MSFLYLPLYTAGMHITVISPLHLYLSHALYFLWEDKKIIDCIVDCRW